MTTGVVVAMARLPSNIKLFSINVYTLLTPGELYSSEKFLLVLYWLEEG